MKAATRFVHHDLRRGRGDVEALRDALGDIAQDGQRASRVVQGLRALFRKEHSAFQSVSINAVIEDVVTLLRHDFKRKRIPVMLSLQPTSPRLLGDAVQLQQVLFNLLMNAADAITSAAHEPREVTVTTYRLPSGALTLSVRDTGVGVQDEAELERIFTRFVSSKPTGLGMGLPISRSIVQRHGGRLWATRNADRGLTFHVELPLGEAPTLMTVDGTSSLLSVRASHADGPAAPAA